MIGTVDKCYDTDGNGRMRVGDKEGGGGMENIKKIGVSETAKKCEGRYNDRG